MSDQLKALREDIISYDTWAQKNVYQQLDRYKGWMLISEEAVYSLKKYHESAINLLNEYRFQWKNWSQISGDEDDKHDFAIKKY